MTRNGADIVTRRRGETAARGGDAARDVLIVVRFQGGDADAGDAIQQPLTRAVQKLTAEHGEHEYALADLDRLISFRPFAPEDTKPATLDLLAAADSRTAVEFTYRKVGGNEAMRRRVHPYHVTCIDSQWYLLAFDTRRKALRTFVVSRVCDARTVDENFIRPADFKPADFCAGVSARSAGRRIIRW
jgi:predicted DNA-binding transcriptional regulator YafY